jgi:hypothetical protein
MLDRCEDNSMTPFWFFENPRFYQYDVHSIAVISDKEHVVFDITTGEVVDTAGERPRPEAFLFELQGAVVITHLPHFWEGKLTVNSQYYAPYKQIGTVFIFKEFTDPEKTSSIIYSRANDLNWGDSFDWARGHGSLGGNGLEDAIKKLIPFLSSELWTVRRNAAGAFYELFLHADHGCFSSEGNRMLNAAIKDIRAALKREENDTVKRLLRKAIKQWKLATPFLVR